MQPQHRRFFESLDWDGWRGNDGRLTGAMKQDLDAALDQFRRQTQGILDEYEERQSFTKPSRERREARQRAKYKQQKRTRDRPKGRGSS